MPRSTLNGLGQGLDGDKTTTGAVCISSLPNQTQDGLGVLRLGDKTTRCPRCGEVGTIAESSPGIHWDGIPTALDGARIECGCPVGSNRLIAVPGTPVAGAAASLQRAASSSAGAVAQPFDASRSSSPPTSSSLASAAEDSAPAEPGFYIVPKSISRHALETELFGDAPSPQLMRKFNGLNVSLGNSLVKAGALVVLGDPLNAECTREEAFLMQAAADTAEALRELTPEDADFMIKHRGQISSFLADTSLWAGVSTAVMERYFSDLNRNVKDFQTLHQDSFRRDGHLNSDRFYAERRRLIGELNAKLLNSRWLRSQTSLGDHPSLKKSLKISTRSLVHHWKKAGGPGPIPGYSKHIQALSNAAKYMKAGGYLAVVVGGLSSGPAIYEACTAWSDEECEKAWMIEGGKFSGATVGGVGAGALGGAAANYACAMLGIHRVGRVLCVAVGVGGGAALGTTQGEKAGEFLGEKLYDAYLYD